MADILVRDIDSSTVRRLKLRAKRGGRSLQGELKSILEAAAGYTPAEARAVLDRWRRSLVGRRLVESTKLIRRDRLR